MEFKKCIESFITEIEQKIKNYLFKNELYLEWEFIQLTSNSIFIDLYNEKKRHDESNVNEEGGYIIEYDFANDSCRLCDEDSKLIGVFENIESALKEIKGR